MSSDTLVTMTARELSVLANNAQVAIAKHRQELLNEEIDRRLEQYNHGVKKLLGLKAPTRDTLSKELTTRVGWQCLPWLDTAWGTYGLTQEILQALSDTPPEASLLVSIEDLDRLKGWARV